MEEVKKTKTHKTDARNAKTKRNKERILKALADNMGIITYACQDVGISRQTFFLWQREDKEFAEKVMEINEIKKDFVERALITKIEEGDTSAILFASRCLNRDRGYSEKQEVKIETNTFEIKIS